MKKHSKGADWGVIFTVAALSLVMFGGLALGQTKFPEKPINLIIPVAAGGGQDLFARSLQPHLEKILGQPLIIINKIGGGGSIGYNEIAVSAPDGYTIGQASPSLLAHKYIAKGSKIDYSRYEPILFGGYTAYGILVRKDAPWNTWKEFYDYVKANPKKVKVGNSGFGSSGHIASLGMEHAAGLNFIHVPYKGIATTFTDILGGHIDAISGGVADTLDLVKGGKLKFMAVAAPERSKVLPNVPTFKELGMDAEFITFYSWLGPKGLSKEKVGILYQAFKKAIETKEFGSFCQTQGVTISLKGPEELGKYLEIEDKKLRELTTIGGIKPE